MASKQTTKTSLPKSSIKSPKLVKGFPTPLPQGMVPAKGGIPKQGDR